MPDVTAAEFAYGIATCERLDDVVAASNAAVADYLQAVVQRVGDCRDAVDGRRRRRPCNETRAPAAGALQAGGNP